jgi:hypothetical protein
VKSELGAERCSLDPPRGGKSASSSPCSGPRVMPLLCLHDFQLIEEDMKVCDGAARQILEESARLGETLHGR